MISTMAAGIDPGPEPVRCAFPDPVSVWDVNAADWFDGRWHDRCAWAQDHFPDAADAVWRAEFYVIDAPFAVLYRWRRAAGWKEYKVTYLDPQTRRIAQQPPLTLVLSDLPPAALL